MLRKKLNMAKGRASTPDDTSHQFQASGSSKPVIRSPYFPSQQLWELISDIEIRLGHELELISYPANVTHVYNPIDYASELHRAYLQKFLKKRPRVLFLGMNPGPFGMCQTGVPFGNVPFVREWMELTGTVRKPIKEHHSRPINGLNCTRTEKSGELFWGLLEEIFNDAEHFFRFGFVHNLCPLAYMNKAGANITPAEFRGDVRKQFEEIILRYLQEAVQLLHPNVIVSLGRYVERLMDAFMEDALTAAKIALSNKEVPVGCIFVYNNKVIATGANLVNETKNATRHAELICIDKVLEYSIQHSLDSDKVFKEISVIVTVEPCIMCAAALDLLCVKEVIYGCKNDRFGGQTVLNVFEIVNSKITINGGVRADETMELLKVFYKGDNPSAPIVKARKLNS